LLQTSNIIKFRSGKATKALTVRSASDGRTEFIKSKDGNIVYNAGSSRKKN
jgi:hypothetical protein